MEAFFQKYGGKYRDPYEAIDLIGHEINRIKEKVAQGDHSHIAELKSVRTMIDDYLSVVKDEDVKPIKKGEPYQDYRPQDQRRYGGQHPQGHFPFPPMYPIYPFNPFFNEQAREQSPEQPNDSQRFPYRETSNIGYIPRYYDEQSPNNYPPYYERGQGGQGEQGGQGHPPRR